jgi:hypothetical protein
MWENIIMKIVIINQCANNITNWNINNNNNNENNGLSI